MKNIRRILSLNFVVMMLAPLLISITTLLLPTPVSAAGETYTWVDFQTIRGTGGNFRTTANFIKNRSTLPGQPETFGAGVQINMGGNNYCTESATITLTSNTSGRFTLYNGASIGAPGGPPRCGLNDQIYSQYNNTTVSIGGTRPGDAATAETDAQRNATFQVNSALPPDQSPANLIFAISGPNNFSRQVTLERRGDASIYYYGTTALDPGSYTATAAPILTQPVSFEKVRFTPLSVTYGESFGNRAVNATIEVRHSGGVEEFTLQPIRLVVQRPDGTQVAETMTAPLTVTPTSSQEQASGFITVDGTYFLRGSFANIDPGQYKLCVPAANACQDFTKEANRSADVTMSLSGAQSDAAFTAATGGEGSEESPSCESEGLDLSWIICPILTLIDKSITALDNAINNLLSVPNDYLDNPKLEATWKRMRNLAYIILVPAMLVMVLGTALGFDFISAYTVKKALPRMIAAAIFIALSWELTVFMVTFINNVGQGIGGLIMSQFAPTSDGTITLAQVFNPDAVDSGVAFTGLVIAGGAGAAFLSIGIVASYALVAVLALLVGFALLSLRQMLIIFLMLFAPLAILAWIFPGNDKLWKTWWGAFSKLLLLYPLIMILLASGKSFAVVVGDTEGNIFGTFVKLIAYVGPYFFIPAAFKFAGGVFGNIAGMVNDRSRGVFDRNKKYRQAQYGQNWDHRAGRRITAARADWQNRLQASNSRLSRAGGKLVGGYNIQAAASANQARIAKELNEQIATGRDEEIRGLTVNKAAAKAAGALVADKDGHMSNGLMRVNKNTGLTEYKSLAGAWVNEGAVNAGHGRWGKDVFAKQTALSYEMRKAMTSDQVQDISARYSDLATNAWGLGENQAGGAWIGAAFENQNQHIEYKNTDFDKKDGRLVGPGKLNAKKFATEVYEKKGSYPLSQMSAHTIDQLKAAYDSGDPEVQKQVQSIAETFVMRGGGGLQGMAEGEVPIMASGGGPREAIVNAPGAAAINDAVQELYKHVNPRAGGSGGGGIVTPGGPGYRPPGSGDLPPGR